jgi:hypothetical protein
VTPLGQLPFCIEYLKQGGLFDGWQLSVALHEPECAEETHVLGTVLLSMLAGHWRYAHITTLRYDPVNPPMRSSLRWGKPRQDAGAAGRTRMGSCACWAVG